MAIFHLYLASCALLLTMSWRTSTGLPVRTGLSPERCERCSMLFRSLLLSITETLKDEEFCRGIHPDQVAVGSKAETVQACAPSLTQGTQKSGCMMPRNSSFSESDCMTNIMRDLAHYAAAFQSFLRCPEWDAALLSPTLGIIQSLRENCSLMPNGANESLEDDVAHVCGDDTYSNRQDMCKTMRGFHVRTITINRAMGYISSGDHRK